MRARYHAVRPLVAAWVPRVTQRVPCRQFSEIHLREEPLRSARSSVALGNLPTRRSFSSSNECPSIEQQLKEPVHIVTQVSDVPDPKQIHKYNWVSDPHGYLLTADKRAINTLIDELFSKYGVEVAVVLFDGVAVDVRPFLKTLFNEWGVGDEMACNGVLLGMVMGKRRLEIVTGDGLDESALDKIWLDTMHDDLMLPEFNDGKVGGGLVVGLQQIAHKLEEWPDRSFAADPETSGGASWRDPGVRGLGISWSGGYSSIHSYEDARWFGPERITLVGLGGILIASVLLYIEDWYFHRDKQRCPECGEFKIARHVEVLKPMTCSPMEVGSKCEHIVCKACRYHEKHQRTVPAAHSYVTEVIRVSAATYEADGLERVTTTCRGCELSECSEKLLPKLVKRKQHAGI